MSRSESPHIKYRKNSGNLFGGNDENGDFGGGNPPHSFGMVCKFFLFCEFVIFLAFVCRGVLLR